MNESISHEDMGNVAASIQAAFQTLLAQTSVESRKKIIEFTCRLIYQEKPYLWVSAAGLGHVIDLVFAEDVHRDFALSLQFHFFVRWGEGSGKFTALTHALSWGAAVGPRLSDTQRKDEDLCAVPPELKSRLGLREEIQTLLADNPWMVCLLLLRSYVSVVDPGKLSQHFADPSAEPQTTVL